MVYNVCVLDALRCNSDTWTVYSRQECCLNSSHLHCLRDIMGINPGKVKYPTYLTRFSQRAHTKRIHVLALLSKRKKNNREKLHARAGQIVYGLPWDTSAEDVLMRTGWDSLETMYKLRLTEFVFKCFKGYTVTEFEDLFLQRNSGRRSNENIILARPETNFIRNSIRFPPAMLIFLSC